jgi:hypothetical protein
MALVEDSEAPEVVQVRQAMFDDPALATDAGAVLGAAGGIGLMPRAHSGNTRQPILLEARRNSLTVMPTPPQVAGVARARHTRRRSRAWLSRALLLDDLSRLQRTGKPGPAVRRWGD